MSDRLARIALGVLSGLALLASVLVDLPRVSGGRFWSDGATYHAMAGSLAFDGDLEFAPADLARVRAAYPGGPQGVFLKRVRGESGDERLVYAKAMVYPLAAAPFARLLGTDRGLLVLNGLLFAVALWVAYSWLRRRGTGAGAAAAGAGGILAGGVVPVYLFWETPEVFNLAIATVALVAWRHGRPVAAALFLGLAAYSKPTNLALALPLVLEPLVAGGARWGPRLAESVRRSLVVAAVVACGFGATWVATGELNYQGGERKTFYDRYPGDAGVTFDSAGVWMATDHLGPLVAGLDEDKQTARAAPPRTAEELRRSFVLNLGYFWVGRFGGGLPYFSGVAAAALLFLFRGPREPRGWLALLALLVSWLGYLVIIPDNWYGGGGTIGNRYFLNLVPLGLMLLPRGRGGWAALAAALAGAVLLAPVLASPVHHSLRPGDHATGPSFRLLPAEVTMLGDLSVFGDVWRKRRPYNAPGGDPARRPAGAPPSYFLWFPDDGTFGQEESFGEEGFWLRGGESAEVVLQALAPVSRLRLVVTAGPAGDIVTARLGRERHRLVLPPLRTHEIVFEEPRPALGYYGTSLYPLRLGSRYGASTERDKRMLGSFVQIVLVDRRAPQARLRLKGRPPAAGHFRRD